MDRNRSAPSTPGLGAHHVTVAVALVAGAWLVAKPLIATVAWLISGRIVP